MRILCLDIGDRKIGVAVSDESEMFASGLKSVVKDGSEIQKICKIAGEYAVQTVVYGLPLRMNGSISSQTEKSMAFIERLKEFLPVNYIPFDERLSSKQADAILVEADLSRKKRKKLIDKLSAQIILQNFLDSRRDYPEEF